MALSHTTTGPIVPALAMCEVCSTPNSVVRIATVHVKYPGTSFKDQTEVGTCGEEQCMARAELVGTTRISERAGKEFCPKNGAANGIIRNVSSRDVFSQRSNPRPIGPLPSRLCSVCKEVPALFVTKVLYSIKADSTFKIRHDIKLMRFYCDREKCREQALGILKEPGFIRDVMRVSSEKRVRIKFDTCKVPMKK